MIIEHILFTYCWSSTSRACRRNWEGVVSCGYRVPDFLSESSSFFSSSSRSLRVMPALVFSARREGRRSDLLRVGSSNGLGRDGLSAREFSNHFKPSISQIGEPDSHGCYASQRETPYPLVFLPLYVESHQEEQRTISPLEKTMVQLRSVPLRDIPPSKSNKCLSIAKGFDDYY